MVAHVPMTASPTIDPVHVLRGLEARCRDHAVGLPLQVEIREEWAGIGFRLGSARLVAPLGEVAEILHYPALSRVPGTKPWVKGIANVRGNLLPIMDLQGYLSGEMKPLTRRSRVLVVKYKDVITGLLVDEVLGMKHFPQEDAIKELPVVDAAIRSYLGGAFRQSGERWGVFSLSRLAEDPAFLHAAS